MDPYVGEIRIFGFNFAPLNWAFCSGQVLPISQYSALFSIIGTNFGGNGTSNFQLPNFQGQAPLGAGTSPAGTYTVGQQEGQSTVTLSQSQLPSHSHALNAQSVDAANASPAGNYLAKGGLPGKPHEPGLPYNTYAPATGSPPLTNLLPTCVSTTGGGLPFPKAQPSLTLNFCIALNGVYPQRP